MRGKRVVAVLAVAVVAGVGRSSAADRGEVRVGATVRATTPGGVLSGTIAEVDPAAITLRDPLSRRMLSIPREEISRLELSRGRSRGKNALIGAGVGLAVGLGVAVIANSQCQGDMLCGVEFALPVLTTPLGALVGVAIPGNQRWVDASPGSPTAQVPKKGVRVAWSVSF
jgi:hypothetical protein